MGGALSALGPLPITPTPTPGPFSSSPDSPIPKTSLQMMSSHPRAHEKLQFRGHREQKRTHLPNRSAGQKLDQEVCAGGGGGTRVGEKGNPLTSDRPLCVL